MFSCCGEAKAQSAPVGIASTASGGGTLCAGSILTYAPTAASQKSVGDGCPATQSTMSAPVAMAIDRYNNVLISDQTNNLLRIIYNGGTAMANALIAANVLSPNLVPTKGYIYTIAGGPQSNPTTASIYYCNQAGTGTVALDHELDGCPGTQAYIQPRGMAFDADGNIFVSNVGSMYTVRVLYVGGTAAANLIKLENPNLSGDPQPGYLYNIAGATATAVFAGDGALAYKASVNIPRGIYIDANENVLFTDTQNDVIRRVDGTTGFISTVVGSTTRCTGTTSKTCPTGAAAGDGAPANDPSVVLNYPYNMVFDGNGNMFIADSGSGLTTGTSGRVRVVYAGGTLPGIANPVVGNIYTYAGGGALTGTGAQKATFQFVYGVAIDPRGYLYIDDYRNATIPGSNHVWRVDPVTGDIVNIAGNGAAAAPVAGAFCNGVSGPKATNTRGDGCPGPEAYLNLPQQAPVFDTLGNFYIADRNNNVVRYFNYSNTFPATAAGSSSTQTLSFTHSATTVPTTTTFTTQSNTATSEYTDAGGDTCVVSTATPAATVCTVNVTFKPSNTGLREGSVAIGTATGTVVTEALTGLGALPRLTIDPATITALGTGIKPLGVSADALGNVYLSDGTGKQVLRTTIAGGAASPVITGLVKPTATATDSFGNLFVADATNNNVVMRSPAGVISTASLPALNAPQGLAPDLLGDVYVSDTGNNRVLLYSATSASFSVVNLYPIALKAPTALAVDGSGDVFILDSGNQRIVELPTQNAPLVVALPSGVVPTSLAVDASGALYITDATSASVLQISASGATTLYSGVGAGAGLAVDANGDVFLADSTLSSVTALNRTVSAASLATTNLGDTSLPATFTLGNAGYSALNLATPEFTETGAATAFPASTPATCSAGLSLAPTASCTQSFSFQPVATGPQNASATIGSTAGGSVVANLSGTAVNVIRTSLALTQTIPASVNASYGQTVTYTVALTPASMGNSAPTGTIVLNVDGKQAQSIAISKNPYIFQLNLSVGTHTVSAAYSGDALYAGSNASTSITVTKAVTVSTSSYQQISTGIVFSAVVTPATVGAVAETGTVAFYVDNAVAATVAVGNGKVSTAVVLQDGSHTFYAAYSGDGNYAASSSTPQTFTLTRTGTTSTLSVVISAAGTGLALTAQVKPASGTGVPSGTVIFKNGAMTLGTVAVSATGSATLTTLSTAYSSTAFTASYSGDGLFQPSVASDMGFYGVPPQTAVGVATGGQAITNVSIVPINGYSGTVTPTCGNLPANFVCRFLPATVTLTTGASSVLQVQLFAGVNPTVGALEPALWKRLSGTVLAMLLPLGGFAAFRRRRRLPALLLIPLLLALPFGLTGCGQLKTPAETNSTYVTAPGSYALTLTLTDTTGIARNAVLNILVTQ